MWLIRLIGYSIARKKRNSTLENQTKWPQTYIQDQPNLMSKLDRLKTEVSFHEKMFFASITAMLALLGWLAANYEDAKSWLVLAGVLGLLGASIFGVFQYRRVKKLLIDIEDC